MTMAESESQSSSLLDEAKDYLVQGRRFMALEDYQSATDCLEQSCQLFDSYYGVAKRECADAYLEYGLALMALANVEAGNDKILISANDAEENDEGDEENDEGDEENRKGAEGEGQVVEDDQKNAAESKTETRTEEKNEQVTDNGTVDATKNDQSDVKPQESSNGISSSTPMVVDQQNIPINNDPQPGTSLQKDKNGSEDDESDEATTIEVAWEVLCLAKRLYMTDESLEAQLKLAETLQKLGEISIEWDNNDNAVDILRECLKLRTAILPQDDRLIAFTYYHLGLAHSFKQETQDANDSFQNAINVIEKRIASHSELLGAAKANQDTVAIAAYEKEINDLKELLPDMAMRIDDTKEEDTTEVFKRTRDEMLEEDEKMKKVCSDTSKPVDDITHLIKRKAP